MEYTLIDKITYRALIKILIYNAFYLILALLINKMFFLIPVRQIFSLMLFMFLFIYWFPLIRVLWGHWMHKMITKFRIFLYLQKNGFSKECLGEYVGLLNLSTKVPCRIYYDWRVKPNDSWLGNIIIDCYISPPLLNGKTPHPTMYKKKGNSFFFIEFHSQNERGIDLEKLYAIGEQCQKMHKNVYVDVRYDYLSINIKYSPFVSKEKLLKNIYSILDGVKIILDNNNIAPLNLIDTKNIQDISLLPDCIVPISHCGS